MAKELVTDELWEAIGPLLPEEPPKPNGGRLRIESRAAFAGILFILMSGIPWEMLPQEMGCGSRMTCWRHPKEWQRQACGRSCAESRWIGWARPTRSTGRGHLWTRRA
jgi:transposase